jgi:hypothetical protein
VEEGGGGWRAAAATREGSDLSLQTLLTAAAADVGQFLAAGLRRGRQLLRGVCRHQGQEQLRVTCVKGQGRAVLHCCCCPVCVAAHGWAAGCVCCVLQCLLGVLEACRVLATHTVQDGLLLLLEILAVWLWCLTADAGGRRLCAAACTYPRVVPGIDMPAILGCPVPFGVGPGLQQGLVWVSAAVEG